MSISLKVTASDPDLEKLLGFVSAEYAHLSKLDKKNLLLRASSWVNLCRPETYAIEGPLAGAAPA